MYDYTQALKRSQASRANRTQPKEISILGADWVVLPDVFSPADTNSSVAHLRLLDFPVGGSFLEIGTGTGLIAVSAALAGCSSVMATDLSPAAVENAALNVKRFGVDAVVSCLHSDLFDALPAEALFDVIYWHSNNTWTPPTLSISNILELAYVDPGYDAHRRFFRDARRHVAPDGRILLAISSRAQRPDLEKLAADEGQRLVSVKAATVGEPEGPVVYELTEVLPV
ncbi:MAG TPA: methyltransferase domain-containing protein [Micromonosporaceae bacterium]|nr:methyltransferase domain-containing protein [Micromonosporaceae bacterium]